MTIKRNDFDRVINKFGFRTRNTDHLHAYFEHDGNVVVRTKRSHTRGDLPFSHAIRQQMKLSNTEFTQAARCHIDRNGYIEILRRKGVIPDRQQ